MKTSGSLLQYFRNELALDNNDNIIDFPANNNTNNSISFKFKQQLSRKTKNSGTKYAEIIVSLKYFSSFERTLEIPLISLQLK